MTGADAIPGQTIYDTARSIEASGVPLDFAMAYPLCRLVLGFGGGPLSLRSRDAGFLDKKLVKRLEKDGWIERSGGEGPRAARVASVLNLREIPSAWTATAALTPGRLNANVVSASDEAILMVARHMPRPEIGDPVTAVQPGADSVVADQAPAHPLAFLVGEPLFLVFGRDDVEARDLSKYEGTHSALGSEFGRQHFRQQVYLRFAGYDDDPRELYQVPEVVEFVHELVERLPWAYYLAPRGGLGILLFCLAGATSVAPGQARLDPSNHAAAAEYLYRPAMAAAFVTGLSTDETANLRRSISAELAYEFDESESAGDVFGEDIDRQIAEILARSEAPVEEPAVSEVQRLRDVWLDERVQAIVDSLDWVGTRLMEDVRPELGQRALTVALLAARVGAWLGYGHNYEQVLGKLDELDVVTRRADSEELMRALTEMVSSHLAATGLGIGEPWRPESGFLVLLERWAVEQLVRVEERTFCDQLRRCWGETNDIVAPYLLGLAPRPLAAFTTITGALEGADESWMTALVTSALDRQDVGRTVRSTMNAMNLTAIPHLELIASEDLMSRAAQRALAAFARAAREQSGVPDDDNATYAEMADEARDHLERTRSGNVELMRDLSEYEISRVIFDPDRRFQDACLDAYVGRYRVSSPRERVRGRHGTYGALPWWCIPVVEEYVDLVIEIIDRREAGFAAREADGNLFEFRLASPSGEGFYVFDYELDSFADVCELMLIGRSGRIGIDFDGEQDGERVRFGTVGIQVAEELTEQLLTVATSRARAMLGAQNGYESYAAVRRAADDYFSDPRTSWSRAAEQFVVWQYLTD